MAPLTPAQKAVLERIEKRKELQQKAAKKRKAKTEPVPDTTSEEDPSVVEGGSAAATKRRRVESTTPNNDQPGASTSRRGLKKNDNANEAQENQQATVSSVQPPVRRGRRTAKFEETVPAPTENDPQEQAVTSPPKSSARRGRKTAVVEESSESPANQTMNEAQLRVLQMLAEKKASKEKGRKSLKPPKEVEPEIEEILDTDSNSELAVSSTVPETAPRGRRKTTNLEAVLPAASSSGSVSAPKRGRQAAKVVPVVISDPEEEAPPTEEPERLSATRVEEAEEEKDQGPLNATMIAVLEKIKEKKARQAQKPFKRSPAKAAAKKTPKPPSKGKSAPASAESLATKVEGPLTPNQISVLKKIQEKSIKQLATSNSEASDDDDDEARLSLDEIGEIFERLAVPLNHREEHFVKRLRNEGVFKAVDEGRRLTKEQNAMLIKYRTVLNAKSAQLAAASRTPGDTVDLTKDESEATDEDVEVLSHPPKAQAAMDSDEESPMDCAEVKQKKTFLIFDTNAYLKIFPYCRAVLESDKLKEEPDFEELVMFALFVVIRELDSVSKRRKHLHLPAMAAIRLIHNALQDKSPRIEGQDFASSKKKLADSEINDDYIVNSASLLQERGENVIVVTDDKNLQVKIVMMRGTSLNCLDFIARYHWLTPLIASDIKRLVLNIGEDILARFLEIVVTSVVLKGVLAHLAPLPMERRRELFPSWKLSTTLALMLKNKTLLQTHRGPFTALNYDRVAQTLNPLQKFDEGDNKEPKDEERFKFFARFLLSAGVLCRKIASFFPNMESRAEFIAIAGEYFQKYLPEDERIAARKPEATSRFEPQSSSRFEPPSASRSEPPFVPRFEQPPVSRLEPASTSRFEPARKALLPTKKPLPTITTQIPEPPESPVRPRVSERRQTLIAAAERARFDAPCQDPEPVSKARTPRQTRVTRNRNEEPEQETATEPVYFSFSQGRQPPSRFEPVAETSKPFALTATRSGARKASNDPYADLNQCINEDVTATVYEYFQKFGLSICNYTGSCCVKLGVRFSLAFKVSTARLETSLPEVTDSFASTLQAMKKIITGCQTNAPARDFLLHSSQVMDAIGTADSDLVNDLPKITADALLAFSRDPEGKQQLVTGYQQFCDFNNCLEKCWLEAQRS